MAGSIGNIRRTGGFWLIKLTEEGKKLLAVVRPQLQENIEGTHESLSDEELKLLGDLLTKLLGEETGEEVDEGTEGCCHCKAL